MKNRGCLNVTLVAALGMCACSNSTRLLAAPFEIGAPGTATTSGAESADAHIVDVVAITQVFADGLKVSGVAIQYDKNIRDTSLKVSDFTVTTDIASQTITKVYTSTDGLPTTRRGLNGRYVILDLSTDYIIPVPPHKVAGGPPPGRPPGPQGPRPEPVKEEITLNSEVVAKVGEISWDPAAHPATLKSTKHGGNGKSVSVTQTGKIDTTEGMTVTAMTAAKDNVYCRNLIVDGFMKPDFATATHGNVKYNIHFPNSYDPAKKYPVVVFLDDSDSPSGYTHAEYLIHGLGGIVWASKEDEARQASIVLVPALSRPLVNESYEPTVETRPGGQPSTPYLSILDMMDGLLEKIPSIDRTRVYLTGQGDGARAAIRMMADRPNLFAAALLFAPDYDLSKLDASKTAALSKEKIWLVTSEGDPTSYASMEAFTNGLKAAGASVGKAEWSGRATDTQFASDTHRLASGKTNIEYVVLKKGMVVPPSLPDDALDNHAYTWRIGYAIPALREWLLVQKR